MKKPIAVCGDLIDADEIQAVRLWGSNEVDVILRHREAPLEFEHDSEGEAQATMKQIVSDIRAYAGVSE